MRDIQVMDGVLHNICTCPISGFMEHSAEIWSVVRPINYEPYTAMGKAYMHVASATAHLFYTLPLVHHPKGVLLVP